MVDAADHPMPGVARFRRTHAAARGASLAAVLLAAFGCAVTPHAARSTVRDAEREGEVLLVSIEGGLDRGPGTVPLSVCEVRSNDLEDPAAVRALIRSLADAGVGTADHAVARRPSLELYALEGGRRVLLRRDANAMQFASQANGAEHQALRPLERLLFVACPLAAWKAEPSLHLW